MEFPTMPPAAVAFECPIEASTYTIAPPTLRQLAEYSDAPVELLYVELCNFDPGAVRRCVEHAEHVAQVMQLLLNPGAPA